MQNMLRSQQLGILCWEKKDTIEKECTPGRSSCDFPYALIKVTTNTASDIAETLLPSAAVAYDIADISYLLIDWVPVSVGAQFQERSLHYDWILSYQFVQ